jgi:hypothetical protein
VPQHCTLQAYNVMLLVHTGAHWGVSWVIVCLQRVSLCTTHLPRVCMIMCQEIQGSVGEEVGC